MASSMASGAPVLIGELLEQPALWLVTRIALTSAFLLGGLDKALNFPAAVAEQAHFGLHPAVLWASASIIVELGGSLLVIANRLVWLGAGGLGVLTAVAMLTANNFWAMRGAVAASTANTFFEHLGLIAGLVLVSIMAVRLRDA